MHRVNLKRRAEFYWLRRLLSTPRCGYRISQGGGNIHKCEIWESWCYAQLSAVAHPAQVYFRLVLILTPSPNDTLQFVVEAMKQSEVL
jgi:hypothetical protein